LFVELKTLGLYADIRIQTTWNEILTKIDTKAATVLLRAFAHPTRLAILQELSRGPKCVADLEDLLPASQANLSQHLALLRHTQLVDFAQDAQTRCYYLARPKLTREILDELARNESPVTKSTEQIKAEKAKLEAKQSSPPDKPKAKAKRTVRAHA
jgi:ArsR family transcriptional regulator, arsenate/arsenite/antimonite-responsive transcriptional repressor